MKMDLFLPIIYKRIVVYAPQEAGLKELRVLPRMPDPCQAAVIERLVDQHLRTRRDWPHMLERIVAAEAKPSAGARGHR